MQAAPDTKDWNMTHADTTRIFSRAGEDACSALLFSATKEYSRRIRERPPYRSYSLIGPRYSSQRLMTPVTPKSRSVCVAWRACGGCIR